MNLCDIFSDQNDVGLFEEYYLKLILLLKNSFSQCSFYEWFNWKPKEALRSVENNKIWKITLQESNLHEIVKKWLQEQDFKFQKETEILFVFFNNDIDCPLIVNDTSFIPIYYTNVILNFNSKIFHDFCVASDITKLKASSLKKEILIAQKRGARRFYQQGFYLGPSSVSNAGFGVFSIGFIPSGTILFPFGGKRITEQELYSYNDEDRSKIEEFACEASFLESQDGETNIVNLFFDPTNKKHDFKEKKNNKNIGPWMNEPPFGSVSNVFLRASTFFNLPKNKLHRYILNCVSAKDIYSHDELFFHYGNNFCRKENYTPGTPCPDIF